MRNHSEWRRIIIQNFCGILILLSVLAFCIYCSLFFWFEFGVLGFFVGPLRTWSFIFYGCLFAVAWRVPKESCVKVLTVLNQAEKYQSTEEESLSVNAVTKASQD